MILDADAIYHRAGEKRRERGLLYSDQQLSDETASEIRELKAGLETQLFW